MGLTWRELLILAAIVIAGGLIFSALPSLGICVGGCPLTPPWRH